MDDRQQYLSVNGTRLYYSVQGEGTPIVFLHGGFTDLRIWERQVKPFARTFQVIRYDQRGYGRSDVPVSKFSYFEDVKCVIEALNLKHVALIGSSFGGSVAIDFALQYPECLTALILVGPALNGYRYPLRLKLEGLKFILSVMVRGAEATLERFIANPYWSYFFPSPEQQDARTFMLQIVREATKMLSWNPRLAVTLHPLAHKRLQEIGLPSLIVLSDDDSAFNMKVGEYIHARIPHAHKVIIPEGGHLPYVEQPDIFNQHVLNFLQNTL